MKKQFFKRVLIVIASLIGIIFLSILIIPLLITVKPLADLVPVEQLITEESQFVTIPFNGTDGIDIHYLDSSEQKSGEPVFVLLHGSMFNSYTWDGVFDYFGSRGRTIAYDQIPYGLSEKLIEEDWNSENPYSQAAAVEQLISFIDAFDIKKVYLVGSSYGGTLAVRAALEYQDRFKGLILIDAAVFVNETTPKWLLDSPQLNNIGPLFARYLGTGTSFFYQTYLNPEEFTDARMELTTINTKVENWDIAMWQYLKAWGTSAVDFTKEIPQIEIPVLVISGIEDKVVPVADSERLHDLLPDSSLVIIPESGHVPHEETPQKFIKAIDPWIEANIR